MKNEITGSSTTSLFSCIGPQEIALWNDLGELLKQELGATSMLYGFGHSAFAAQKFGFTRSVFIIHNHPQNWIEALGGKSFLDSSTYAAAVLDNGEYFFWQDAYARSDLTEAKLQQLAINRSFGMDVGITIPLPFANGRGIGGAGICFARSDGTELKEKWKSRGAYCLNALRTFDAKMRPLMVRNRLKLTRRERDVLAYSAGGLIAKEIAAKLGIETKTVYNTLERARKNMRSPTTMEAIAKAYVYELI